MQKYLLLFQQVKTLINFEPLSIAVIIGKVSQKIKIEFQSKKKNLQLGGMLENSYIMNDAFLQFQENVSQRSSNRNPYSQICFKTFLTNSIGNSPERFF